MLLRYSAVRNLKIIANLAMTREQLVLRVSENTRRPVDGTLWGLWYVYLSDNDKGAIAPLPDDTRGMGSLHHGKCGKGLIYMMSSTSDKEAFHGGIICCMSLSPLVILALDESSSNSISQACFYGLEDM